MKEWKMTKAEEKRLKLVCDRYEKRCKEGKEVFFQFIPFELIDEFRYDVKATKDKQGNIHIKISREKKK
ncbi:MAG: hypothetical protein ACRD9Q_01210 [Nitrososphaeraceae archaeon]